MEALDYVTTTLNAPIDLNYLKKLHQISQEGSNLFITSPQDVGHIRSENNREFDSDLFSPRSSEINKLLDDAITNYNKSPKKMSDICLLYLWIMSIHPFIDGNGRVAELII
jgi:Fic family protein